MDRDWKKEVFSQKSLRDIFVDSSKSLPRSPGNTRVIIGILIFTIGTQAAAFLLPDQLYGLVDTATFVHTVSETCFVLSLSVLGFLVAGFSIFASITRVELFITLANIPYKKNQEPTGLNRLQFIFFNFMNVFSVYFVLLSMSIFINVGYSSGSPLARFGDLIAAKYPEPCMVLNIVVSSVYVAVLVEAVLRLKSFIWNLYQSVLLSIVTSDELNKIEAEQKSKS